MSIPAPTVKLTLEQIIADIDQMPSVPDVIMRLSRMLEDPNITAEELGQVIQLDTKLTAQLLKISNSAYYGLNRKIMSMKEAVAILGNFGGIFGHFLARSTRLKKLFLVFFR